MARFYAKIVNRQGRDSGAVMPQSVALNGWNSGVELRPAGMGTKKDPVDAFEVYLTGGNNDALRKIRIGVVVTTADGPVFIAEADRVSEDAAGVRFP
jgi:hypothetical protein